MSTFGPGDIAKGRVSHITLISIAFPNVDSYQTKDFPLSRLAVVQMKTSKVSFTQRERLSDIPHHVAFVVAGHRKGESGKKP